MGSLEGEEPIRFPERTMSRLPDLRYDEMTAEQQRVHDEIKAGPRGKVVGPLKVWLYSAELADRAQRLGAYVRYNIARCPPNSPNSRSW
jgi:4-carboxymuconolactone decarboxylase